MLTVHMGLHKTGSTAIQTVLGIAAGHIRRKQIYLRWTDLFVTDGVVNWQGAEQVRERSRRGWHVVVSSEGGLGSMESFYSQAFEVSQQLSDFFDPSELQIVVYLRPHLPWMESAYGQHVVEGGTLFPGEFHENLSACPNFSHSQLVSTLLDAGGPNLRIRPYVGRDVVTDFFTVADLGEVPGHLRNMRARSSQGAREIMQKRQCNEPTLTPLPVDLHTEPSEGDPGPTDRESVFSREIQELLYDHFALDWAGLCELDRLDARDRRAFAEALSSTREFAPRTTCPQHFPNLQCAEKAEDTTGEIHGFRGADQVRALMDRTAGVLRHGPRLALLKYLTSRTS